MKKIRLILFLAVSLFVINNVLAIAQDTGITANPTTDNSIGNIVAGPASSSTEPEIQWIWGEVTAVDPVAKTISIKYLDYETDQEKDITVVTNDATTYENAKVIEEIKPQDTVSVDYVAVAEGNNVAKNISVEKPDLTKTASTEEKTVSVTTETIPEDVQPAVSTTTNTAQ